LSNTQADLTLNSQAPASPPQLGNHSINQNVGVATITSTPISVSAGSSVYIAIQVGDSQTVTSVTDSQSNTFTGAANIQLNSIFNTIWYFDGVVADPSYTVTVNTTGTCSIQVEVAEFIGTATPSLDTSNTRNSPSQPVTQILSITLSTIKNNDYGFLSCMSANNSGSDVFTEISSGTIIDVSAAPVVPSGVDVTGASLGLPFGIAGDYTMNALSPHNGWNAVIVGIAGAIQSTYLSPIVNASLEIVFLGQ
jgi:hypothetical protein